MAFGRSSLLTAASAAEGQTLLALVPGTNVQAFSANLTTFAGIAPSANIVSLLGAPDYASVRLQLSLVPGTNVQAFDTELGQIAGLLDPNANRLLGWNDTTNAYDFYAVGTGLTLTGGLLGVNGGAITGINGPQVAFADNDGNFAAPNVQEAIEELDDVNGAGPNAGNAKVDWSQLSNVPSGFADGVDDSGSGGGGADPDAIHDNVSGEITAIADKTTPVVGDHLLIEDSQASNVKKDITVNTLKTPLESIMVLSSLQGSITDAQVPDSITITTAASAATARYWGLGDELLPKWDY